MVTMMTSTYRFCKPTGAVSIPSKQQDNKSPVNLITLLAMKTASAKSLFRSSLTKLERSYYAVGSSSTKSGICDYLFEYRPRYFIIDGIEKMNKRDQTSLLNLMESGILSELKHNQKRMTQLKT